MNEYCKKGCCKLYVKIKEQTFQPIFYSPFDKLKAGEYPEELTDLYMIKIKKAVIPVAGFGTRFLPATKAQPKEMLPIVDKPSVQYAVEEAVAAGIEDIILITGQNKRAIEDHFDSNFELEESLRKKKKTVKLKEIQDISQLANFIYIRQKSPLGNGHAVLCAKSVIGDDPFVVIWPDDLIDSPKNTIKQMIDVYQKYQSPVIGVLAVPDSDIEKYGIIKNKHIKDNIHEMLDIVEKPSLKSAPSNLASLKGYVLGPEIFGIQIHRRSQPALWG
jgi:UTP--glucose-1-phosphate uridylyltransferase